MKLIDGDMMRKAILETKAQMKHYADIVVCDFASRMLDSMPEIDAVPVVRGEWVTTRTIIHDGEPYCSLCGQEALAEYGRYTYIKSNYCPNCGAKMEREK